MPEISLLQEAKEFIFQLIQFPEVKFLKLKSTNDSLAPEKKLHDLILISPIGRLQEQYSDRLFGRKNNNMTSLVIFLKIIWQILYFTALYIRHLQYGSVQIVNPSLEKSKYFTISFLKSVNSYHYPCISIEIRKFIL